MATSQIAYYSINFIVFYIVVVLISITQQQCPTSYQLSFNGQKCYSAQIRQYNFFTAENYCKQLAASNLHVGTLASPILNAFENNNMLDLATGQQRTCREFFIGLHDFDENNSWTWNDGSAVTYKNWKSGCPSAYNSTYFDRCATIDAASGRWCNRNCSATTYCFICQIILNTTTTTTTTATTAIPTAMTDCYDWRLNGATSNGIYQIDPGYGLQPFDVYCDMTTDGGGWTVIQRRVDDNSEMWKNTWQQYKNGFNNSIESGNLWLGNDRIHVMTQSNVTLRVEINGDRSLNSQNPNLYLYGTYNFSISDEKHNYTLQISLPIKGNASDANPTIGFMRNNGMPFSTVDKSSNAYGSYCANTFQFGGWWFNRCTFVALNGKYNPLSRNYGFLWYSQATGFVLPNRSEMKIRRQ